MNSYNNYCVGNTILSAGGTGTGIEFTNSISQSSLYLYNNYIEGFSGAGGEGINMSYTTEGCGVYGQNACYNNETNYTFTSDTQLMLGDNEVLTATGLVKSGADTFANRFTYFAPANVGNMQTGGYPQA